MEDVKEGSGLCTDVSDLAIGVVLMQERQVLTDKSRKLNYEKLNYQIHEKELLARVCSLKVWRRYLLGTKLKIETDHQLNHTLVEGNANGWSYFKNWTLI